MFGTSIIFFKIQSCHVNDVLGSSYCCVSFLLSASLPIPLGGHFIDADFTMAQSLYTNKELF